MTERFGSQEIQDVRFDEALAALESLVQRLEVGGLGLEDALALYEQGIGLVNACTRKLDSAELRLNRLQELSTDDLD